ncbi:MAG TPA: Stp1/IreP family PP2C-type Ser/Thr phosphatase [Candidatus Methylomirabilis sp.]|nr:Stp1/IreP family PP2C-type Ser/Thr phosphatase [Candidatus Methylomirabilis sp.]
MKIEYAAVAKTDVGRKRQGNEDSFCVAPELGLYVVADGMGGHAAGEVASRLAVETIHEWMEKYLGGVDVAFVGQPMDACSREANFLLSSIRLANRVIFEAARGRREYRGMGTTLVSVLAVDNTVALAHVGDSRIYRIRDGQIIQLSRDHSVVQQQVDRGVLSPEEAHESQYRHLITRALGLKDSVEVDLAEEPVLPGDILLLCSDGLSDLLEDEEILVIVRENADDLEKACQALVDRANVKGGDDNITAMLVQARAGSDPAGTPPTRGATQRVPGGMPGVLERLREKWGR